MNNIEHLVFLVNKVGDQAGTAAIRIAGSKRQALNVASAHGFIDFNVIERSDGEHGFSDQRVATMRDGALT